MEQERVILYTKHCPNCNMLERKLLSKNIKFEIFDDVDKMIEMGMKSSPMLKVNDNLYTFAEAIKWVNSYGSNN